MMMDGNKFQQQIMQAQGKCRSCGTTLTFSQAAQLAKQYNMDRVVMCHNCGDVYTVELQPNNMILKEKVNHVQINNNSNTTNNNNTPYYSNATNNNNTPNNSNPNVSYNTPNYNTNIPNQNNNNKNFNLAISAIIAIIVFILRLVQYVIYYETDVSYFLDLVLLDSLMFAIPVFILIYYAIPLIKKTVDEQNRVKNISIVVFMGFFIFELITDLLYYLRLSWIYINLDYPLSTFVYMLLGLMIAAIPAIIVYVILKSRLNNNSTSNNQNNNIQQNINTNTNYTSIPSQNTPNNPNTITEQSNEDKKLDSINDTLSLASLIHKYSKLNQNAILDKDYQLGIPMTFSDGNMVIDGNGHTIYGGNNTPLILNADNITLRNLNFKNFTGSNHGGVIQNQGKSIKIENCTFENNKITKEFNSDSERFGGVIDNQGELEVINCHFMNNQADSGACIHTEDGFSDIENSTFENNFANLSGGGALSLFNGKLKINESTFKNNESRNFSGAIRVSKGEADITNSNFIKNKALQHGGAISINEGRVNVENSIFEENEGHNGGAINQPGGSLILKNCTFSNNRSNNGSEGSIYTNGNLEDSECKFMTKNDGIYK